MSAQLEEVAAWVERAVMDLRSARILRGHAGLETVACYLSQQACEKALKALLVAAGKSPPRVHDLVALGREVRSAGFHVPCSDERLSEWSAYAVASRYPGFVDVQAERDLPDLLECAETLVELVRALGKA